MVDQPCVMLYMQMENAPKIARANKNIFTWSLLVESVVSSDMVVDECNGNPGIEVGTCLVTRGVRATNGLAL